MKRIIVIGGGPGGYTAALKAAKLGAQVMLVEREEIGGLCTNWGCIPTKIYKNVAHIIELERLAPTFGLELTIKKLDFHHLQAFKDRIVDQLRRGIKVLLEKNGVNIVKGQARFLSENKIEIENGEERIEVEGDGFIVATGSVPKELNIPGGAMAGLWTSRELVEAEDLPQSIAIIGGGVVGIEFAFILAAFGLEVSVIELLPHILPGVDTEIVEYLENTLARKIGVNLYLGRRLESITYSDDKFHLYIGKSETISVDRVLVAIGREPADTTGLYALGAKFKGRHPVRDEFLKTSIPNIYAIGDFAGEPLLAHKASFEGEIAALNLVEGDKVTFKVEHIPKAIFSTPEVGSVGLNEDEARERGYDIKIGRFQFSALGRASANARREGFIKVIAEVKSEKLLGIHILGEGASEILAAATVAVAKGLTVKDFNDFVFSHPTLSEGLREAVLLVSGEPVVV